MDPNRGPPSNGSICRQIPEAEMDPNADTPLEMVPIPAGERRENWNQTGTEAEKVPMKQQRKEYRKT